MEEILKSNMVLMYFLYGLSFYTMGVVIALQYRSYSSFRLAHSLSLLAAFGLLHGFSEWGSVFIPAQVPSFGEFPTWKAMVLQRLMVSISYLLLFLFGAKLVSDSKKNNYWWYVLPGVLFLGWFLEFSRFVFMVGTDKLINWLLISESWSRYLLAFPAGLLTAYGLALQIPEVKKINNTGVVRNLWVANITFCLFAIFSGLVIPPYLGGVGKIINNETFYNTFGLPIELFRTVTALIITWSITNMLVIFDLEKQKEITESRRIEAVLRERERIACDLHDDVIQSIYGIGLGLQIATNLIENNQMNAKAKVIANIKGLQKVITSLRAYIQGLEKFEHNLELIFIKIVEEFREKTEFNMALDYQIVRGVQIKPKLHPEDWQQQVRQIVREAINNIHQHAEATVVKINVFLNMNQLVIVINDNGLGISNFLSRDNQKEFNHMGIANMYKRARLIGGDIQFLSQLNRGTKVIVTIPVVQ